MKKTPFTPNISEFPSELHFLFENAAIYDSSCSADARVFFIDKNEGYYLKSASSGALKAEAEMTAYFYSKGLATEVLSYISGEKDFLLTRKAYGEDCTHESLLGNPRKLCDTLGTLLRKLHETDFSGCPVQNRLTSYFELAEKNYRTGNYDTFRISENFGCESAEEAWKKASCNKHLLKADTLIHGDYCLPNIMLSENMKFSAYIDVGNGGIGDRHIDLFWGAWSLGFNLGTDKYRERFFDAYGRDRIDFEVLPVVAAFEVFG